MLNILFKHLTASPDAITSDRQKKAKGNRSISAPAAGNHIDSSLGLEPKQVQIRIAFEVLQKHGRRKHMYTCWHCTNEAHYKQDEIYTQMYIHLFQLIRVTVRSAALTGTITSQNAIRRLYNWRNGLAL